MPSNILQFTEQLLLSKALQKFFPSSLKPFVFLRQAFWHALLIVKSEPPEKHLITISKDALKVSLVKSETYCFKTSS